jgi:hypothetical protein
MGTVLTLAFLFLAMGLVPARPSNAASDNTKHVPLKKVADIPMPGPAVRFDYQSLDASQGRLYIAHMNADQLVVFDTKKREVVANLDGFFSCTRSLGSSGAGQSVCIGDRRAQSSRCGYENLQTLAKVGTIDYPGMALLTHRGSQRIFVSDEHGNVDAVIDTKRIRSWLASRSEAAPAIRSTIPVPATSWLPFTKERSCSIDPATLRSLAATP